MGNTEVLVFIRYLEIVCEGVARAEPPAATIVPLLTSACFVLLAASSKECCCLRDGIEGSDDGMIRTARVLSDDSLVEAHLRTFQG